VDAWWSRVGEDRSGEVGSVFISFLFSPTGMLTHIYFFIRLVWSLTANTDSMGLFMSQDPLFSSLKSQVFVFIQRGRRCCKPPGAIGAEIKGLSHTKS
jgi:Na+-transporting NADH:ubiquinone oxidoreductase subunit NqrB